MVVSSQTADLEELVGICELHKGLSQDALRMKRADLALSIRQYIRGFAAKYGDVFPKIKKDSRLFSDPENLKTERGIYIAFGFEGEGVPRYVIIHTDGDIYIHKGVCNDLGIHDLTCWEYMPDGGLIHTRRYYPDWDNGEKLSDDKELLTYADNIFHHILKFLRERQNLE